MRKSVIALALMALIISATSSSGRVRGVEDPADYVQAYFNPTPGEMPIVIWDTYNEDVNNLEDFYQGMAECGANICFLCLAPNDTAIMLKSLDMCGKAGLKEFMHCRAAFTLSGIKTCVDALRDNPNLAGFAIEDEPIADKFEKVRKLRDIVYSQDTTSLLYVNLFPTQNKDVLHADSYSAYVEEYIRRVQPPFLSYDQYPIRITRNGIVVQNDYFLTLETIYGAAKRHNLPFWAFGCIYAHDVLPIPTVEYLRFQVMNNLAYGAQGIQYYTYVAKEEWGADGRAPIMRDGSRTEIWYTLQQMNQEIKALTPVFLGCEVIELGHTGILPAGTHRLQQLPKPFTQIQSGSEGILVSHIRNSGVDYVVMVNHDIHNKQKVRINWRGILHRIGYDGQTQQQRSQTVTLDPGSYAIFY